MAEDLIARLREIGVDADAALRRFAGNTALYQRFLGKFIDENTMLRVREAAHAEDWAEMLAAAHTLKGVTGNLGLDPLYRASEKIVAALRAEDLPAALSAYSTLEHAYAETYTALSGARENGVL